jgi:hypothetical protein
VRENVVIVGAGQAGGELATEEFMAAKRLVSNRAEVDVTRLGDAAVPLTRIAA